MSAQGGISPLALHVDPGLRDLIPPLTPDEDAALRLAIGRDGITAPIVVWQQPDASGLTIVDGHNRHRIAHELGLPRVPFATREFVDRAAVVEWMVAHQSARRSLTRDQLLVVRMRARMPLLEGTSVSDALLVDRALEAKDGTIEKLLAGTLTLRMYARTIRPDAPRTPRAPRGVSASPCIPEGHELAGLSTLTGPDGATNGQWAKTRIHGADDAPNPITPEGHHTTSTATMVRGDGTTVVQWVTSKPEEVRREEAIKAAWARHASTYAGLADPIPAPPPHLDVDLLTVYPLGDPHIGMLAWGPEAGDNFDTAIACRELLATVQLLVDGAPASAEAIVCNLGDFLHAQDDSKRTPGHGNQLDVDGRFAKVLDAGHTLLRGIVDTALRKHAHVRVRNLPGNHDPRVAAELAMWLRAVYEREPRVVIEDAYAAHQYDQFGDVLLGWHHGDRSSALELPAIMATDRAAWWGTSTERVWHVGHVHHLTRKESPGCVVETHRTMAAKDAWHAGKYRSGRSLQAITYHRVDGEVSRNTVGLARVHRVLHGPKPISVDAFASSR